MSDPEGLKHELTESRSQLEVLRARVADLELMAERNRLLFDATPDAITVTRLDDATVLEVNGSAPLLWGYSRQELVGRSTLPLLWADPKDRPPVIEELTERGVVRAFGWNIRTATGEIRRVESSAVLIELGGERCILAATRDVTEHEKARKELEESRALAESLVTHLRDGIAVLDPDGVLVRVNPAFCRMTGYDEDELIGLGRPRPYWPPEEVERIEGAFADMTQGRLFDLEYDFLRKTGEIFPVVVSPSVLRDAEGEATAYLMAVKDLSALKEAQAELEASEARYRALVEDQTEYIVRWLPDGTRTFVNRAYCEFFGGTPEEVVGTSFVPLISDADRDRVRARIAALSPDHPVSTDEHRVLLPDESPAGWQQWTDRAFFDEDGNVRELLSVGRDVTDRKRTERALRDSEQRLAAVFAQSQDYLNILSPEGGLLEVNRAIVTGLAPEESPIYGAPLWEQPWVQSDEARGMIERAVRKCAGGETAFVTGHYNSTRGLLFYQGTIEPIRDDEGEIVFLFALARDVTEEKLLERELAEIAAKERQRIGQDLHDSLGQQLTGLGFLARALEQKLAERGLSEAEDAAAIKRQITSALRETRLLARGLLPVTFDVGGLEGALTDLAAQTSEVFGVECLLRVDASGRRLDDEVLADLFQITREAVTNAVRHGQPERVEIHLSYRDDAMALSIMDDGIGLPSAASPHSGLGFRIMRYRSSRIGASLEVTSGPRGGTAVTCILPRSA